MDNLGTQLREIRKRKGLSVADLESAWLIPKDRIYKWEKGTMPTDPRDYLKVESFITTGILETVPLLNEIDNQRITRTAGIERSGNVAYYDVDFTAGEGFASMVSEHRPTYNMDIPGFGGCIAFNVYGDSMEPRLKSGSVVFGRKIEEWREHLEYGQVYGIVMKDERRYLKYIRKAENHKTEFLLRSENTCYDDFEIPKKSIHNIWLIEGWMLKTA